MSSYTDLNRESARQDVNNDAHHCYYLYSHQKLDDVEWLGEKEGSVDHLTLCFSDVTKTSWQRLTW